MLVIMCSSACWDKFRASSSSSSWFSSWSFGSVANLELRCWISPLVCRFDVLCFSLLSWYLVFCSILSWYALDTNLSRAACLMVATCPGFLRSNPSKFGVVSDLDVFPVVFDCFVCPFVFGSMGFSEVSSRLFECFEVYSYICD